LHFCAALVNRQGIEPAYIPPKPKKTAKGKAGRK